MEGKTSAPTFWQLRHRADKLYGGARIRPVQDPRYPWFRKAALLRVQEAKILPYKHPQEETINAWIIPEQALEGKKSETFSKERGEIIWVDSERKMTQLIDHLQKLKNKVISMDIENSYHLCYHGQYPCLIQVSTVSCDFLICTLKSWPFVQQLKPIMEDPSFVKIVFGAVNDLKSWYHYFDIFPVGIVDVQILHDVLTGEGTKKVRTRGEALAGD